MCPNTILLKMKLRYYEMVNQFSKHSNLKNIFTRSWINSTIEKLLHIKDMTEAQKEAHTNLIQNYKIKIKSGRNVLTKLAPDKKTMDELVPLEDSFETALYAHLVTGHGSAYHIILWLEENGYIMANLCVPIVRQVCSEMSKECVPNKMDSAFLPLLKDRIEKESELCYVATQTNEKTSERVEIGEKPPCDVDKTITSADDKALNINKHKKDKDVGETSAKQRKIAPETKDDHTKQNKTKKTSEKSKSFKGCRFAIPPPKLEKPDLFPAAMISLKNMHHFPDSEFKLLLVYKDYETEFVQLRPLTQKYLNNELTMELFKIFCDFSTPKCIVVSSILKETFEVILNDIKNVHEHNIMLKIANCEVTGDTMFFVERKLKNWILNMGDSWSVGCHAVQWEMNNMNTKGGSTPYKRFFGIKRVKNIDKGNEKVGEHNSDIDQIETNRMDITTNDDRDQCDDNSKSCRTSTNATHSNVHNRLSTVKQTKRNLQNSHHNINIANDYITNKFTQILQNTSNFNRELSKESNIDQSIDSNSNSELNHNNIPSSVVYIQSESRHMPIENYVVEVIKTVPDPIIIKTEEDLPISTEKSVGTLTEANNLSQEKCYIAKDGNENVNRVENKIEKLDELIDFAYTINSLPNINIPESSVQFKEKSVPDPIKVKSEDDFSMSIEEIGPTGTENINIREDSRNTNVNNIINRLKFELLNFAGSPEPKSSHNENVTESLETADTDSPFCIDIPMSNSTKTFDYLLTDKEFVDVTETDTNTATVHDGQANRESVTNVNIIQETPKLV